MSLPGHFLIGALQKHYFGTERCDMCVECECAKSKFQRMDRFDKGWTILILVGVLFFGVVWYIWGKRIFVALVKRIKGDLGLPMKAYPINFVKYKTLVQKRWIRHHTRVAQFSKESFKSMGQIDGQLVGPCDSEGNPLDPLKEQARHFIELMGNLVTVYAQDKPCQSMYTHPQDTILEIMEKFKICADQVFTFRGECLDDFDKTLLEYGVPDNWKIGLVVEPRLHPALEESSEEELEEIFKNL